MGKPDPDAPLPAAGRGVKVLRVVHVRLDNGDVATIRQYLPEMRLDDAVRHILDVWIDDRMGPSPEDALAMLEVKVARLEDEVAMLEDADDAGADR